MDHGTGSTERTEQEKLKHQKGWMGEVIISGAATINLEESSRSTIRYLETVMMG